jgi:hypothetical protein
LEKKDIESLKAWGGGVKVVELFDEEDFCKLYRGTRAFCVSSDYYKKFLELLKDEEVLSHIRFANDTLQVPPIKSMLGTYPAFFKERGKMTPQDKQSLGACFGYLYRFIYGGYTPVSAWVGDVKDGGTGIKTASYFIKEKQ